MPGAPPDLSAGSSSADGGELALSWTRQGPVRVLHAAGTIAATTAGTLRAALVDAASPDAEETVVVDLTGVGALGAVGVATLRVACEAAGAEGPVLHCVAAGTVVDEIRAAGLDARVVVYPTIPTAIAAVTGEDEADLLRDALIQRRRQLRSQPVIEQAKGMLMQDFGLTDRQAFDLLVQLSQDTNTKVHDVAAGVLEELRGSASGDTSQAAAAALASLRRRLRS